MPLLLGFICIVIFITFVVTLITKKPFIFCLGNMFCLAAIAIIIWSFAIDDGSRRGMEALVLAIMWGIAVGSFLVGFILRKIGVSQIRKKILEDGSVVKMEAPE